MGIICESIGLAEHNVFQQLFLRCRKFFFSHLNELGYHKALWYGRGMRYDVGIVGWWFASNYGSSLTYFALGTILENMGKEVLPVKDEPVLKVDYVAECEKQLSKHLGRGVKIVNGKRKGRFELEFYGQEDLQVLLDTLMQLQK